MININTDHQYFCTAMTLCKHSNPPLSAYCGSLAESAELLGDPVHVNAMCQEPTGGGMLTCAAPAEGRRRGHAQCALCSTSDQLIATPQSCHWCSCQKHHKYSSKKIRYTEDCDCEITAHHGTLIHWPTFSFSFFTQVHWIFKGIFYFITTLAMVTLVEMAWQGFGQSLWSMMKTAWQAQVFLLINAMDWLGKQVSPLMGHYS